MSLSRIIQLILAAAIFTLSIAICHTLVILYHQEKKAYAYVPPISTQPFPPVEVEPTKEPKKEEPKVVKNINPYDSLEFTKRFPNLREVSIAQIRTDNYGAGHSRQFKIKEHKGGKMLPIEELEHTVRAVIQRMPNLRTTPELIALCMETMATETSLGEEKISTAIERYKNYGIAQFRMDTAKETLTWLQTVRPDVYEQVEKLASKDKDLQWNLCFNVPYSVALMIQYYWRRVPDLYSHINTVTQRAEMWKAVYNSPQGLGTVNKYIKQTNAILK